MDTYYYMLTNVNRAKYYVYNRTRYYRDVTVSIPSTGDWVAWQSQSGYNDDGNFRAKYWYGGNNNPIRQINTNGTSYTPNDNFRGLNNNHMYVIQITAASNQFALGNPNLDNNYQSKDHVVSPAFMIASQLGAVIPFDDDSRYQNYNNKYGAQAAAWHCGRYMEVGTDVTDILKVTYSVAEDNARKSANGDPKAKYRSMAARHKNLFRKPIVRKIMRYELGRKIMFFFFGKKKDKPLAFPTHSGNSVTYSDAAVRLL